MTPIDSDSSSDDPNKESFVMKTRQTTRSSGAGSIGFEDVTNDKKQKRDKRKMSKRHQSKRY